MIYHTSFDPIEPMTDPKDKVKEAAGVVTTTKPRHRQGMKGLLTYHSPAVIAQLKIIGAEHDKNQQQLVTEALNMLFTKYGKNGIA